MKSLFPLFAVTALVVAGPVQAQSAVEQSMTKAGCMACHTKDKKLVGPAFKEIATKYKGQVGVVSTLTQKVRVGGKGSFGPIPMSPNPIEKISDAELKAAVEWILQQ